MTLVLANLVPIAGVYLWGWRLSDFLTLYWIENAVVGLYTVLTLLAARPDDQSFVVRLASKVFAVPFFVVHYGMFWVGHGIFLATFFGGGPPFSSGGPLSFFLSPVVDALSRADVFFWPVAAMVASHGVAFVSHYLARGEYRTSSVNELMMRPYGRVVLLHVTIVLGGFLAMFIGPSHAVLLLFVLFKIVADVAAHRRSQRRERPLEGETASATT